MITRSIFILIFAFFGTAMSHARSTDNIDGYRFAMISSPNYLMSYKICFGEECTYGDEAFIRDGRGVLTSEEKREAVLDFIWSAVEDAQAYNIATKEWENIPDKKDSESNNLMQRHMPEMAQRQRLQQKPEEEQVFHLQEDLSVSISFPYDEATLPQIMEAVECLKMQLDDYKKSKSFSEFYPRHKDT